MVHSTSEITPERCVPGNSYVTIYLLNGSNINTLAASGLAAQLRHLECDKFRCFGSIEGRLVLSAYTPIQMAGGRGKPPADTPPHLAFLLSREDSAGELAYQLMRRDPTQNIAIVDGGDVLGRGIAYSTPYWSHALNGRAKKMNAFSEDAGHFLRWARRNSEPVKQRRP